MDHPHSWYTEDHHTVWVVTQDDYSHEGLEGAFDVYVGVAGSALEALAMIDDGRVYQQARRFELDLEKGRVLEFVTNKRVRWSNGECLPDGEYESQGEAWTIREVEV